RVAHREHRAARAETGGSAERRARSADRLGHPLGSGAAANPRLRGRRGRGGQRPRRPAPRGRTPARLLLPRGRRPDGPARADVEVDALPAQGRRELLFHPRRRLRRRERGLVVPRAARARRLHRRLDRVLLEQRRRVVCRGRAAVGPSPGSVSPHRRLSDDTARSRAARRRGARGFAPREGAVRDRPAAAVLPSGGGRPDRTAAAEREEDALRVQGKRVVLVGWRRGGSRLDVRGSAARRGAGPQLAVLLPGACRSRARRRRRRAAAHAVVEVMDADPVELRVLGSLIEKQRTTPDQYPLSLNALRLACNQSTNREPVVDYDESTIRRALERLGQRGWARLASGAGSRAIKHRHLLNEALGLDEGELSLLAVLLLRG